MNEEGDSADWEDSEFFDDFFDEFEGNEVDAGLYLDVSSDEDSFDSGIQVEVEDKTSVSARGYQSALIELAKNSNIIVCLPTGSGKTFIALQLAKHYINLFPEKKIIFLANTVPLTHQQGEYFRSNFSDIVKNQVITITGDNNVDAWNSKIWQGITADFRIFFMTTEILKKALDNKCMSFEEISLLILDECHHATKNHPMAEIMHRYRELYELNKGSTEGKFYLPRVLGLTATIVKGNCSSKSESSDEIKKSIKEMEANICCKAVTSKDYEEVLKYSSCAKVTYINFVGMTEEDLSSEPISIINRVINFLELFAGKPVPSISKVNHPTLKSDNQFYSSKSKYTAEAIRSLREIKETYIELGPFAALLNISIKDVIDEIEFPELVEIFEEFDKQFNPVPEQFSPNVAPCPEAVMQNKFHYIAKTAVDTFRDEIANQMGKIPNMEFQFSQKVRTLLSTILHHNEKMQEVGCEFQGIVFVKKRISAQILNWLITDLIEADPRYAFIKSEFVLGISRASNYSDFIEIKCSVKKQSSILKRFRKKELNLLIATDVLEEGLDVQSCNMILRFDEVFTYPSFIQSMGRARSRHSIYYVLVNSTSRDGKERLEKFQRYAKSLTKELEKNVDVLANSLEEDEELPATNGHIKGFEPFRPFGIEGPQISINNAISHIHEYCNSLAVEGQAIVPVSWWNEIDGKFIAHVVIPNSALRGAIKGLFAPDKTLAKKSAYMEALKKLYASGVMNESLMITTNKVKKANLREAIEAKWPKKRFAQGTSKDIIWYQKHVPADLEKPFTTTQPFILYSIQIKVDLLPNYACIEDFRNSFESLDSNLHFGILTQLDFDFIQNIELKASFGNVDVKIQSCEINMKQTEIKSKLNDLKEFQDTLYKCVLKIDHPLFVKKSNCGYLIVPLTKNGTQIDISWKDVEKAKNLPSPVQLLTKMGEERAKNKTTDFVYNESKYEDAIVIPIYSEQAMYYCVSTICRDLTPKSFLKLSEKKTYAKHFESKYDVVVNENQNLLRCKQMAKNLNFLNQKLNSASLTVHRAVKRIETGIVELIPELCLIFDFSATLYIQSRFLPSIIHRINRLFCAREIQENVAAYFEWNAPLFNSQEKLNPPMEFIDLADELRRLNLEFKPPVPIKKKEKEQPMGIPEAKTKTYISSKTEMIYFHPDEVLKSFEGRSEILELHDRFRRPTRNNYSAFAVSPLSLIPEVERSEILEKIREVVEDASKPNIIMKLDYQPDFSTFGGPSVSTIMEAMTLSNAQDHVNLERLEVLGDSFLKYVVSLHIFSKFDKFTEGEMTTLRSKLVSNVMFNEIAEDFKLGSLIAGSYFEPEISFTPHSFSVDEKFFTMTQVLEKDFAEFDDFPSGLAEFASSMDIEEWLTNKVENPLEMFTKRRIQYSTISHSKIGGKSVADSFEALVGAYFAAGGCDSALRFIHWSNLKGLDVDYTKVVDYQLKPSLDFIHTPMGSIKDHFNGLEEVETLLQYRFKNPFLLLEAMTHPNYLNNRATQSYQRLEFLGDAVLDFLVTNHIYNFSDAKKPGELTDLKSALVNNLTFGALAVRYQLHTLMLSDSKKLQDEIYEFHAVQAEKGHKCKGEYIKLKLGEIEVAVEVEVPKALGDIFESLAGAVFIDTNLSLDKTWKIFFRLMKAEIFEFSKNIPKSPVRELYELCQESSKSTGTAKFTVEPLIKNQVYGKTVIRADCQYNDKKYVFYGCGTNKKSAKMAVAKYAMDKLTKSNIAT